MNKPPIPGWAKDNKNSQQGRNGQHPNKPQMQRQNSSAPINLSLSEDERSPNRSSAEISSPQLGKANPAVGQVAGSSPPEEEDLLYEYFPLSVDDWYVQFGVVTICISTRANVHLGCLLSMPYTGHTSSIILSFRRRSRHSKCQVKPNGISLLTSRGIGTRI